MFGNTIQQSLLDQVFSNNDALVYDITEEPPLGKSDHIVLDITLNLTASNDFIASKRKIWSKVTEAEVLEWSEGIDWGYSDENVEVEHFWKELHDKLSSY